MTAGELRKLISLLVGGTDRGSRFLFTSRVDFELVEAHRLGGEIGRVDLGELRFREAVYLMETLPPLDGLPLSGESAAFTTPASSIGSSSAPALPMRASAASISAAAPANPGLCRSA